MKTVLSILKSYIIIITLMTFSVIIVQLIPNKLIDNHVKISSELIIKEGLYKNILNFKLFQLDNFTDALMLNVSISGDSNQPVKSALFNYMNVSNNDMNIATDTRNLAESNLIGLKQQTYGRYWHGYLIFLKPLLVLTDYSGIRTINYFTFFCLFSIMLFLIFKRLGLKNMLFCLISFVMINFFIIPLSIQFSSVFYISIISIIIMLSKKDFIENNSRIYQFFFLIGGFTSFFDLLTAPLITLGLPLIIYLLSKDKISFKILFYISLLWILGYSSVWASKWLIGSLITGSDFMTSVVEQFKLRTSNSYLGMEMTIPNIIKFIFEKLHHFNWMIYFWLILLSMVIMFGVYLFLFKDKKSLFQNIYFLLIFMMFPIWFLVLRNHTIQHGWFTWRSVIIMIFSIMIFIDKTIDINKLKKRKS